MAQLAVKAIELQSFDSASLLGTYQAINPNGLDQACFMIEIINGGTTAITISYDGTTDNDVVFANSIKQIATPINTIPNSRGALFKKGQIVWVKGTAGIGNIGLAGYYQLQN